MLAQEEGVGGSDVRVSREPVLEHFRGTLQEQTRN
jgi:hypothetical protein